MKRFFAFTFITSVFTMFLVFMAETSDLFGMVDMRPTASFTEEADGSLTLSWTPIPYPCTYRVEVFNPTTGLVKDGQKYHFIAEKTAQGVSCALPPAAIPTVYKIHAYGIFGRIEAGEGEFIPNPRYALPYKPTPIYKYDEKNPASVMPFLVWHTVPGAVCYELEILDAPPTVEGGTALAKRGSLFSTRQIYTNGYQADLRSFKKYRRLYWRVRALGLHHEAVGEFCDARPIIIDVNAAVPDRPLINDFDKATNFRQPLYPVYDWIPLHDFKNYEVELFTEPPEANNANNVVWRKTVKDASTCYDEYGRGWAGEYYWRVRAVDEYGRGVSAYAKTQEFTVEDYGERVTTAIFGDSITHGGGAVSYPPSALEYCYGSYLDFPVLNLGRSGDTSTTSLARFDRDVLPFRPKNLIILMGSNSLRAENIDADDIIADLAAMKKRCEENDIRPIFLTLMPINPKNIEYAFHTDTDPLWRKKMVQVNNYIKHQDYFIDLEPYFYDFRHEELDYNFSIDGLHPDIRGKMLMGEIINMHKNLLR